MYTTKDILFIIIFYTVAISAIIAFVVGAVWLEGWILLWIHRMIHPASVFANGNVWVYAMIGLGLSLIFGGSSVTKPGDPRYDVG
jgi:hypothetical protein